MIMRIEQSDLPKLKVLLLHANSLSGSTSTKTSDVIPYYYKNTLIMRSECSWFLIIRSSIFDT